MYDAKANREYYLRNGRCPMCGGKRPVEPGTHRCRECAIRECDRKAAKKQRWITAGRCSRCGGELADDGRRTCPECRAKALKYSARNAQSQKTLSDKRKEGGKCVRCGVRWAEAGHTLCKQCLQSERARSKRYDPDGAKRREKRQQRIDAGLCIDCGTPTENGRKRCQRCIEMRRDSTRKYKIIKRLEREVQNVRGKNQV